MQKITFEFIPTRQDYLESFRVFYLKNWGLSILLPLSFLGLSAALALTALLSEWANNSIKFLLISAFLFILFLLVYSYIILPVKSADNAQKGKHLGVLLKCEADAEGLTCKSPFIESRQNWEIFHKIIESPHYLLLLHKTNKNIFQIIPKRAFLSNEDLLDFKELIKSNINPAGDASQVPKPKTLGKTLLLAGVILAVGGSCFCLLLLLFYNLSG